MGLFDTIRFQDALLDSGETEFQSKDLDCRLDVYLIKSDGTLWRTLFDEQRMDDYSLDPDGNLIITNIKREIQTFFDYSGCIRFYTSTGHPSQDEYKWYEYVAAFENGHMQSVSGGVTESGKQGIYANKPADDR